MHFELKNVSNIFYAKKYFCEMENSWSKKKNAFEQRGLVYMGKHFHLIGHFLKNAQSSENMYEIFFGPLKNAQLSENACAYPRASILT